MLTGEVLGFGESTHPLLPLLRLHRQKALYPIPVPCAGANLPPLHQTVTLGPSENMVSSLSLIAPPEKKEPANFTMFGGVVPGHRLFEATAKPGAGSGAVINTSHPFFSAAVEEGEGSICGQTASVSLRPHEEARSRALLPLMSQGKRLLGSGFGSFRNCVLLRAGKSWNRLVGKDL